VPVTTIKQSVYFFQTYPDRPPRGTNLTWSHYRELTPIRDHAERVWYEERASQEEWARDRLASAIKRDAYGESKKSKRRGGVSAPRLKRPTQATYVYKADVLRVVDGDTLLSLIDLGFTVKKEQRLRLAKIDTPPVETKKGREADGMMLFSYVMSYVRHIISQCALGVNL